LAWDFRHASANGSRKISSQNLMARHTYRVLFIFSLNNIDSTVLIAWVKKDEYENFTK